MPHVFVRPEAVGPDRVRFDADEAHHLRRVLRLRPGAVVEATDGTGRLYTVRLEALEGDGAWGTIETRAEPARESPCAITLAQALLAAGASHVIATLWRIDDNGASILAERFYRYLSRSSVAEALAAAQRELLRTPRYANPYYWAGFTLSGDGGVGPDSQFERAASVSPN